MLWFQDMCYPVLALHLSLFPAAWPLPLRCDFSHLSLLTLVKYFSSISPPQPLFFSPWVDSLIFCYQEKKMQTVMKAEAALSVWTAMYLQLSCHHTFLLGLSWGGYYISFHFISIADEICRKVFFWKEGLLKSAAGSQLFGVQNSFYSFSHSSAAHTIFFSQNFCSRFKYRMCLCFILYYSWKNTCKMNFQASCWYPYKSASIYSHSEPIRALLVKQKCILHGRRTQIGLCSEVQSSWGCTRHFKLCACAYMAASAPLIQKPARC